MTVTPEMINAADSVLSRVRPGIPDDVIRLAIAAALASQAQSGETVETPAPQTHVRVPDLTNEQKEITLLRIIDAMGGRTDSSDYPGNWLTWFCSDEIHNVQEDTFNRCNDKGWLHTTHDTSFDTSTTTLTAAGRAALASEGQLQDEEDPFFYEIPTPPEATNNG